MKLNRNRNKTIAMQILLTLVIVSIPLFMIWKITRQNAIITLTNGVSARYWDTIKLPKLNSTVIPITKYNNVISIFIILHYGKKDKKKIAQTKNGEQNCSPFLTQYNY